MSKTNTGSIRFGANYTPSQDWAHAWEDIRLDEVRRDFDGLASLGLDHVRLLPLWPVLQPNRTLIRPGAVEDVRAVVDVAAEFGMDASVDVIQGHLSSFDYLPAWITTWHKADMFTDARAISGEIELVRVLGTALDSAPNFLGLTLGNELDQFSGPPHPEPMPATPGEITTWLERLLEAARDSAPSRSHLHAEYDGVFFLDNHPFTPAHAARIGDVTSIHSWIFNGTAQRYGGMSPQALHHGEYLIELSRAFATDPERPVWLQEIGAPSNCLEANQMPDFLEQSVRNAAATQNLWGVTWWCSHDVSRSLADFPELEYSLGLLSSDREVKAVGRRFQEVVADLRSNPVQTADRKVAVAIEVDEDDTPVCRPALAPGGTVFEAWMDLAADGERPALVLSSDTEAVNRFDKVTDVLNHGAIEGFAPFTTMGE